MNQGADLSFSEKHTNQKSLVLKSHVRMGAIGNSSEMTVVGECNLAKEKKRALASDIMEEILSQKNLNKAYKRVKKNKGAPGVDGMTVEALSPWLKTHKEALLESLNAGCYQPNVVRAVEIPKSTGGTRMLGIPTVLDRVIQQAISQVLQPIFEPVFSEFSYGFRPGRGCHKALKQGGEFVKSGKEYVVDIDLESFFDRVNHDLLMSKVAGHITDKRVLKLIRAYLNSGILIGGLVSSRLEGTPQGGPLSPLLSNILLDSLDKELEKRGHSFCRYADDCNIYVGSEKAGERVLESVTHWIEKELKLKVNKVKSSTGKVQKHSFLGYTIFPEGRLLVSNRSKASLKRKVRYLTKRRTPRSLEKVIDDMSPLIRGWTQYFKLSEAKGFCRHMDGWVRRRLRAIKLQQLKRSYTKVKFLRSLGVIQSRAWRLSQSGKGNWRLSKTQITHEAMTNRWFEIKGYESFEKLYQLAQNSLEPPYT